jgi:hypothetical protein
LAEFYDVELTESELETVTDKCSFSSMKKIENNFVYRLPLHPSGDKSLAVMNVGSMLRKGSTGDGKVTLTENQQHRWTMAEEEVFSDDSMRRFARDGTNG